MQKQSEEVEWSETRQNIDGETNTEHLQSVNVQKLAF